jgi:hypothetical protein
MRRGANRLPEASRAVCNTAKPAERRRSPTRKSQKGADRRHRQIHPREAGNARRITSYASQSVVTWWKNLGAHIERNFFCRTRA